MLLLHAQLPLLRRHTLAAASIGPKDMPSGYCRTPRFRGHYYS
jgi:hypothetical protein